MTTRAELPDERALHDLLARRFGHARFRPGQPEALGALLEGGDVLAVLPTGAGKSLIYQMASQLLPGPTVVVSPLIALMRDQADAARELGLAAARIDSSRGERVRRAELEKVGAGRATLVFCTPEQLEHDELVALLRRSGTALVVVDEAHAAAEWGRGFRPAYLGLHAAIAALGRPRTLALTATANPWERREIVDHLGLRDPAVIVRGTDRPNLFLEVHRVEHPADEIRALERVLDGSDLDDRPALAARIGGVMGGKGIVFTRTTQAARETARWLRGRGVAADHYHGRRRAADRERVQTAFAEGRVRVLAATNAFGLGVDVPDVRWVVHRDIPANLEAYHQEIGRAGRDGRLTRCVLIYRPGALGQAAFMVGAGRVERHEVAAVTRALREAPGRTEAALAGATGITPGRLARVLDLLDRQGHLVRGGRRPRLATPDLDPAAVPLDGEERREAYERSRLEMMRAYAEADGCRRRHLLAYFGEAPDRERCWHCDNDLRWPRRAAHAAGPPPELGLRVGQHVRHRRFGLGIVEAIEADTLTVVFDDEGFRTLDAELVATEALLTPAERDPPSPIRRVIRDGADGPGAGLSP